MPMSIKKKCCLDKKFKFMINHIELVSFLFVETVSSSASYVRSTISTSNTIVLETSVKNGINVYSLSVCTLYKIYERIKVITR